MVGIDEVGRGAWAGPLLVVAAKAYTDLPNQLKDSKLLTKQQRKKLLNQLSNCCKFGEGWVSPVEIDKLGLADSLRLGVSRALDKLKIKKDEQIIIDGRVNYIARQYKNTTAIVKADNSVPIVSAASIYAKVTRDNYMANLDNKYPDYDFYKHVGYGTAAHTSLVIQLGFIDGLHRLSFEPMKSLSNLEV